MLESISFQADRLLNIRDTDITEAVLETSINLLSAIVEFYTACLDLLGSGLLGDFTVMISLI